jgi:glycosyltransferase involved in cell wall biosynthesis
VVISTRNRPNLLRRSMQSILDQTVRPLELIVVDGCSERSNESVIADLAGDSLEICYRRLTRLAGAPTTRNVGAQQARGEILMFLDDDDVWAPEKIETQPPYWRSTPRPEPSIPACWRSTT